MRLRVLGRCEVEVRSQIIPFRHKAAELLGLLVVRRMPVTRAELAATLWPDAFDADARHNLRQTLFALRNRLGQDDLLAAEADSVSLYSNLEVDLWLRDALWADRPLPEELQNWEPFMAPLSADWVVAKRADDERRTVDTALRMGEEALAADPAGALSYAQIAKGVSPSLEAPRSLIVRAYLALEDQAAALREIAGFDAILTREFGSPATHRLRSLLKPLASLDLRSADLEELSPRETLILVLAALPALASRPTDAQRALREALSKAGDVVGDERANAEVELAKLALAVGDLLEAEAAVVRASSHSRSVLTRARASTVQARALVSTNRVHEAWELLQSARAAVQHLDDVEVLADIDGTLGACLLAEHRAKEAETVMSRALVSAERAGSKVAIARIVHNRAIALMHSGRLTAAAAALERYLPEAPPSYRAKLEMSLGRIRETLGHRRESEQAYTNAVAAFRKQEEPFYLAQALTYVADAALARGDLEAARPSYEEAIMLRRTIGDRLGLMTAYKGLGTVAHRKGKLGEAEAHLREAVRFSIEIGEPMTGASARLALARVLADAGQREAALVEAQRAKRGILGLKADAASLTTDDTLSIQAADDLLRRLGSEPMTRDAPAQIPGS